MSKKNSPSRRFARVVLARLRAPNFAAMTNRQFEAWIAADEARDPEMWAAIHALTDDELIAEHTRISNELRDIL